MTHPFNMPLYRYAAYQVEVGGWLFGRHDGYAFRPVGNCKDCKPHKDAGEANRCYISWRLDHRMCLNGRFVGRTEKCLQCGIDTDRFADVDDAVLPLCDDHRTFTHAWSHWKPPVDYVKAG